MVGGVKREQMLSQISGARLAKEAMSTRSTERMDQRRTLALMCYEAVSCFYNNLDRPLFQILEVT